MTADWQGALRRVKPMIPGMLLAAPGIIMILEAPRLYSWLAAAGFVIGCAGVALAQRAYRRALVSHPPKTKEAV